MITLDVRNATKFQLMSALFMGGTIKFISRDGNTLPLNVQSISLESGGINRHHFNITGYVDGQLREFYCPTID